MITLFTYPFRTRAERVIWVLNELNLPYQVKRISPSELKTINPLGKAPAIEHEGKLYTESLAIMEYLVSLTNRRDLIPRLPEQVYKFRNFIFYLLSEVEAYLWISDQSSRLSHIYAWPEGTNIESRQRVEKAIRYLFEQLEHGDYVCECFTLADIYGYHIFSWAQNINITLPEHILRYMQRLERLASFPPEMKNSG